MKYYRIILSLVFIFSVLLLSNCKKENNNVIIKAKPTVFSNFESGSIGEIEQISDTEWDLNIANDNNDVSLPDSWRNWWYVGFKDLTTTSKTQITLKNRGWPYYYCPVYSYDQKEWNRFTEDEVSQNVDNELVISKQFEQKNVWLARFYPYTFSDLENYMETLQNNPYVEIQTPGNSQAGKPIYLLRITDNSSSVVPKTRVMMHARTHPAETPPSFLLEGFIDFLLNASQESNEILANFEFFIFPMQNVDGVIEGNYRSTPQSENLEVMWYYDSQNPFNLSDAAPQEVSVLHKYAQNLMTTSGPPVSMALNLHASNSAPDVRPFFYPHFGSSALGYSDIEASLWEKQISFINHFASHYGAQMIEPVPSEGGSNFATKTYPESWWWVNFQDQVLAMTFEITYGKAGYSPNWIIPNDIRKMGESLALGIRDYYSGLKAPEFNWENFSKTQVLYPELYAPLNEDGSKR